MMEMEFLSRRMMAVRGGRNQPEKFLGALTLVNAMHSESTSLVVMTVAIIEKTSTEITLILGRQDLYTFSLTLLNLIKKYTLQNRFYKNKHCHAHDRASRLLYIALLRTLVSLRR